MHHEIRKQVNLTKWPFDLNITLLPAPSSLDYQAFAQAVIDEDVRIVETTGNSPEPIIMQLKAAEIKVIHKAITNRHVKD